MPLLFPAYIFAACASIVILAQAALVFGARAEHLALGGPWLRSDPTGLRVMALLIAVTLGGFACAVLRAVGAFGRARTPGWLIWGIVALTATGAVANAVSPLIVAQILWAPLAFIMSVTAAMIAVRRRRDGLAGI